MDFKDYYATLGVTKKATDAEIKRAYRKLARQHHPDLNPGDKKAEVRFKEINEAHEVLSNQDSRRRYDELGANWRAHEQTPAGAGQGAGWGGPFAGGGGGTSYRTMTPEEMEAAFGSGGDGAFSDFFQAFFGGAAASPGGPRRATRQARGQDIEQRVELTLEEAFAGTSRRVGSTREGKERSVEVRIPAGVADGARVRAAGEGPEGSRGGRAGDLYLRVAILPHSRFERRGQDLYVKVDAPVTTAVLGGEVVVPAITGGTLRLKVPELTPVGRTFRLRGHGMPNVGRADERGDLYATVQVQLPTVLSEEERRHYEALRTIEAR